MAKRALIIVDVQNDFCPEGSLPVPDGDQVVPVINRLMPAYDLVVATKDWHQDPGDHFADDPDFQNSWPPHCVVGSEGANYHPDLNIGGIDEHFTKGAFTAAYSGFEAVTRHDEPLAAYLKKHGITHVAVTGLATDFCVKATALDAVDEGFTTTVLLPACRGIAATVGESDTLTDALAVMRESGVRLIEHLPG